MFRRSASSLLLAGLLFADGSWFGRLEQLFHGFLGGESHPQAVWAASDRGGTIDPNGRPTPAAPGADSGGTSTAERGVTVDPNG